MRRSVVIAIAVCVAVAVYALTRSLRTEPPNLPKDELRWVPVADEDLLTTLGARVFRVHIPRDLLQGKKRLVFVQEDSLREQPLVAETTLPAQPTGPIRATLLLKFDSEDTARAPRYTRVFLADTTRFSTKGDNPVAGFNVYEGGRGLSDLTGSGLQLCAFSKTDGNEKWRVRFLLRVE